MFMYPTNMTCMNKIVICSPSDYPSLMAFMVDLTSCGIELVTSGPFEMFTSLGSLPSLPFVLGTSTFAFGSSKGFDGDCSTFVEQWRWSWCPWYRWLDPFTPCMFQWKLYGGSCPFAGRCQFADSRIRRLGESHVLKIVGVEFQRRKDMQDISKTLLWGSPQPIDSVRRCGMFQVV